ncbi:hypothetical protein HY643_03625 [Candidatus Woesearchaeota archaeon]|nr:hypothetical protein [Candidatus Woesearchaeota archaeon]
MNSLFGNKGFVLSMDAAVAISIVIVVLVISSFYLSRSEDSLPKVQMMKTGSDIIAVLDNEGFLQSSNATDIKGEINDLLPPAYNMRVSINGTFLSQALIIETGTEPVGATFIGGGKRFFVITSPSPGYGIIKFWIWLK